MDIRFLTTFLEVVETRHFGKAADNLYLTQSAVSARIKLLEEYFNTSLFVRNRNSIQLTSAGEKLVPYAEELNATLQRARRALTQADLQHLSFASTSNAYHLFGWKTLESIQSKFDELSTRVEILPIEQIARQLHEHSVDIGFSTQILKSDDIESFSLPPVPLSLFSGVSNSLDTAVINYVHIDWDAKVSELFFKFVPKARQHKMVTSTYVAALPKLHITSSTALLPSDQDVLAGYQKGRVDDELSKALQVPRYVHFLKSQISNMQSVIEFIRRAV